MLSSSKFREDYKAEGNSANPHKHVHCLIGCRRWLPVRARKQRDKQVIESGMRRRRCITGNGTCLHTVMDLCLCCFTLNCNTAQAVQVAHVRDVRLCSLLRFWSGPSQHCSKHCSAKPIRLASDLRLATQREILSICACECQQSKFGQ